jgi:hypothetical protein
MTRASHGSTLISSFNGKKEMFKKYITSVKYNKWRRGCSYRKTVTHTHICIIFLHHSCMHWGGDRGLVENENFYWAVIGGIGGNETEIL